MKLSDYVFQFVADRGVRHVFADGKRIWLVNGDRRLTVEGDG